MTMTTMVVMEPGSDWPGPIGDSTNVVALSHGCEDLVRRTQERVDALRKQSVRVAVLACNSHMDGPVAHRRPELARILLGAIMGTTCGRLILSASGGASLQLRQALFALAGELTEQLRGTRATVSLRFAESSPRPAVRLGQPMHPAHP